MTVSMMSWIIFYGVESSSRLSLCSSGRVSGCRSRGPGLIPGATTFSEKQGVWNGVHSAS
jgi:hypothetical protein